jgi:hypothetical protein
VGSRLEDRNVGYQAAISGRIALLGNRVANEFEQEVRRQLTDLHNWQENSVRTLAHQVAEEQIGWF